MLNFTSVEVTMVSIHIQPQDKALYMTIKPEEQ